MEDGEDRRAFVQEVELFVSDPDVFSLSLSPSLSLPRP